jgi:hypothetical protein
MALETEKAGPVAGTDLRKSVLANSSENSNFPCQPQDLILAVFGRSFVVVHEPIGDRFRKRAPSRIRAWRTP